MTKYTLDEEDLEGKLTLMYWVGMALGVGSTLTMLFLFGLLKTQKMRATFWTLTLWGLHSFNVWRSGKPFEVKDNISLMVLLLILAWYFIPFYYLLKKDLSD